MKIMANGITIHYEIIGEGENLILIHGMGDTLKMWYNQIPSFSTKYRVITYDVRGFGQTEGSLGEITMATHCEDLNGLMKALGIHKTYLLGFSMGGRIAMEMAATHPEKIKALIMANSTLSLGPATRETQERRRQMMGAFHNKDLKGIETATIGAFSPGFKDKNPAEFQKYFKVKMENIEGGKIIPASLPTGPLPDVNRVKCPVLFIIGEYDPFAGVDQGKEATKMIPGSRMVVFPTGHAAAIEMPERFNAAVIGFLSEADHEKI